MSKFSAFDVSKAKVARTLQKRIGRPSVKDFIRYVENNMIPNCPVTSQDIRNAETIWGPDLGCLKGKTVWQQPKTVQTQSYTIPASIMQQYKDVILSADVMKVNGIPFLTTISRHIKFGSAGKLDSMENKTIVQHFKVVIGTYALRGFRVTIILADNQFESMRGDLADLGATVNIVSRDEHVPEIERFNRTIKDRVRAAWNVLPFTYVPPILTIELVYNVVFWRNMFALKGGISTTQSPSELILNRKLDFNAHCRVEFGDYVQTHEEHDNGMGPRTVGAIATRPTGNAQGGYYFIRLDTGRRINRRSWTALPMPAAVIDQVHRLARRAKANKNLSFTNLRNENLDELYAGIPSIDDDDLDPADTAPDLAGVGNGHDSDSSDSEDEDYEPNGSEDDEDSDSDDDNDDTDENETTHDAEEAAQTTGVENEEIPGVETTGVENEEIPGVDIQETTGVDENDDEEQEENNERTYQSNGIKMNLRSQPRKNYDVFTTDGIPDDEQIILLQFADGTCSSVEEKFIDEDDVEWTFLTETLGWKEGLSEIDAIEGHSNSFDADAVAPLAEFMFLTEQMGWKKGLKMFQEKGEVAIQKELKQIHDMEGFNPKHWFELTKEERANALKYLMYLKEKRDGKIKGRGCADGRPQRLYIPKGEASSPTASLAGLIITCVIDAYEGRKVATADIPGAFLQTKMPKNEKDVHVVLDGRIAELLAKIAPDVYQEYVHQHRGQSMIYCKLNVALYGTLKAALLFWKKLTESLKLRGFVINPYDWCIANKMINGKQCTIVWHVDDLKISHVDEAVLDGIIASLKEEYGKVGEMTITRGPIHDYLGMTLDFSKPGKFIINMEKYLDQSVLVDLPEDMNGTATSPAAEHLFKTRSDATKLDKTTADLFHHITAQLLFVCKRGRPDIQTAVAFLCTRVREPDEDDYKKLCRLVKYIRRTKFLRLTMEAAYLDQNHWFIDGAFAVHNDMRSHSGSFMTFGKGMMDGGSNKQKLNTRSSTETETVAVHDYMPAVLWTRYFMEEQGYPMMPSIIYQDNHSSILLETNGRGSSSKRTRHMHIRYFFVADCQQRGHVQIKYCPTDEMIGDFFTKPLGGSKFRRFRNIIMNCDHDDFGPVDVDELMKAHYTRIYGDGGDGRDTKDTTKKNEPEVSRYLDTDGSQECVGRNAYLRLKNVGIDRVMSSVPKVTHRPRTWAEVAAE
jgi:hypothetical protein